jgi:carbamate kinase
MAVFPAPVTIAEKHGIKRLMQMDFLVICCGGGGAPVIREGRTGISSVIEASRQYGMESPHHV